MVAVLGTTICADAKSFGCKRFSTAKHVTTKPPGHLHAEERVRLSFEYGELPIDIHGRKIGVKRLTWLWGLKGPNTVRTIYMQVRYGTTIYRASRTPFKDRILDVFEREQALIGILVKKKGRLTAEQIGNLFREQTRLNVSTSTIIRKLKELKVEVCRRRYRPMLTPACRQCRFLFGAKYSKERWRHWIDLDEKWQVQTIFFVVDSQLLCFLVQVLCCTSEGICLDLA